MNLLTFLIIFPLISLIYSDFSFPSLFNISIPNISWEFNYNFDLGKYISQLKSSTPEYITKIQKSMSEFIKKTEKEKDKYLDILSNKVQETYSKVKTGIKEGSENIHKEMKELIETTTEMAKILSYKVCQKVEYTKEQCYINKTKIFSNLIQIVDDNFGKCSKIVNEIYNLSDNIEYNLKYFLFLVISLTENFDSVQKGMSLVIFDIINCLQEKFPTIWTEINNKIISKTYSLNVKQDIINLLAKSISNLITFSKYEEAFTYIEKTEKFTGFKITENGQKIYRNIFSILKKFNEFGTRTYNISTNLNLDVFNNEENSSLIKNLDYKDKGIKINLYLSYMLKDLNVHSVQAVVFDSPLVSFKAERKAKNGISNIFVGITLYDKEGNEIYVKDIKLDKIEILFKKSLYKSMKTCLYYNEDKNIMDNEGINTENVEFDGIEYIKCIPQHLSSFTIGSFGEEEYIQPKDEEQSFKISFLKVIVAIIIVFVLIYLYRVYRKKRVEAINNQYNA